LKGQSESDNRVKALSLLGLARRAGLLLIGQDSILRASNSRLFIVRTEDCSQSVLRKIERRLIERGSVCFVINGVSRERLGGSIGANSAQIAALPIESGLAKNLAELLQ
jgi:ribosomal protein L7Ae-like RNA K-turn-binding protein